MYPFGGTAGPNHYRQPGPSVAMDIRRLADNNHSLWIGSIRTPSWYPDGVTILLRI